MRVVFVSQQFWHILDLLLPPERADARPSRRDFTWLVLPRLEAVFSEHWEALLPSRNDDRFRTLFGSGFMLPLFEVQGQMHEDGIITLVSISIDWDFAPFANEY